MVARELEDVFEGDVVENGDNCVPVAPEKAFQNAEEEIAVYQNQLVMSKDNLTIVADMYQQDYIDKVEQRLVNLFSSLNIISVCNPICIFHRVVNSYIPKPGSVGSGTTGEF